MNPVPDDGDFVVCTGTTGLMTRYGQHLPGRVYRVECVYGFHLAHVLVLTDPATGICTKGNLRDFRKVTNSS